jgi:hypothetical protein
MKGSVPPPKTPAGALRLECPYCGSAMVVEKNADVAIKYCWSHAEFQAACGNCHARGPAVLVPREGSYYQAGHEAAEAACTRRTQAPEALPTPVTPGGAAEVPPITNNDAVEGKGKEIPEASKKFSLAVLSNSQNSDNSMNEGEKA